MGWAVSVTEDLHKRLKAYCRASGRSMASVIDELFAGAEFNAPPRPSCPPAPAPPPAVIADDPKAPADLDRARTVASFEGVVPTRVPAELETARAARDSAQERARVAAAHLEQSDRTILGLLTLIRRIGGALPHDDQRTLRAARALLAEHGQCSTDELGIWVDRDEAHIALVAEKAERQLRHDAWFEAHREAGRLP